MGRRFEGTEERELIRLYEGGMTVEQLAGRYATQRITVSKTLRRNGVHIRGAQGRKARVLTDSDRRKIVEMYEAGTTQAQIAKHFGTHAQRISCVLAAAGVRKGLRHQDGRRHPRWKGGRIVNSSGYVMVALEPGDPMWPMARTLGYVAEHRLVVARSLGRPLRSNESVHHVNGDKKDNRLENLQCRSSFHGKGVARRCRACGSHDIEEVPL